MSARSVTGETTHLRFPCKPDADCADEGALARAIRTNNEIQARPWLRFNVRVGHEVVNLDLHYAPGFVIIVPSVHGRLKIEVGIEKTGEL